MSNFDFKSMDVDDLIRWCISPPHGAERTDLEGALYAAGLRLMERTHGHYNPK